MENVCVEELEKRERERESSFHSRHALISVILSRLNVSAGLWQPPKHSSGLFALPFSTLFLFPFFPILLPSPP